MVPGGRLYLVEHVEIGPHVVNVITVGGVVGLVP